MRSGELRGRRLVRLAGAGDGVHVGVIEDDELTVLDARDPVAVLQGREPIAPVQRGRLLDTESCVPPAPWRLLVPVVAPETWAAGVTYERSRDARLAESQVADVYDLVYAAQRPELFIKDAAGRRTVGPGEPIAIRTDSDWSVPEPELAIVLGEDGAPLAVTIGNDVSARDIEGANPLYLPQAKVYARACALGPALLVPDGLDSPFEIELRIMAADGEVLFAGRTATDRMHRSLPELVEFLRRDNPVPAGSVLLTGTGIVPPDDVSLSPGQQVEITITGIGTLCNPVTLAAADDCGGSLAC